MNAPMTRKQRSELRKKLLEEQCVPDPIPRVKFVPNPCPCCEAIRPKGKEYSRVYCKVGNVRYVKCGYCGHTWKQKG